MNQPTEGRPLLAEVAEALDKELERYQRLATNLTGQPLTSEKSLRRAAQALGELEASEHRLGDCLQGLVVAIGVARERHQAEAAKVQEHAELVRSRSEALAGLMVRWQALGAGAGEVSDLAKTLGRAGTGATANGVSSARVLEDVEGRVGRLIEETTALAQFATAEGFADLGQQADSLRLQLLSAQNQLRLLGKRLGEIREH